MEMSYEFITPDIAAKLLTMNGKNRQISKGTVRAYVQDIVAGHWDEHVGSAISIDSEGILRDGQHRLTAIVESGIGVHLWVCRGVSPDGTYDGGRTRSTRDQLAINTDLEKVYTTPRYISLATAIISHNTKGGNANRRTTWHEIQDFTKQHKSDLDGFFMAIPQSTIPKISITVVHLALFMGYVNGVKMKDILDFYEILCSGMSTEPEEFPIIAYRNYLKDSSKTPVTWGEISRCQYALKKYLTKSCTKRSIEPKELIYPFPYENERSNEK